MSVHLSFHGAARTVTGSKYLLSANGKNLLIDAGMFQGLKRLRLLNWATPHFSPKSLDRILLTHIHLDHTGYLPRLVKNGFRGKIHATEPTIQLAAVLLHDAAKLQEEDARYANKKKISRHKPALPLFDAEDVDKTLKLMKKIEFDEWLDVGKGIRARWQNSGHILGSAMIEVHVKSPGEDDLRVLFSGDVGRYDMPLHVDPSPRPECDILIIESTYGKRTHADVTFEDEVCGPFEKTFERGGVVVIPSFALGRTQLVALILRRLMRQKSLREVPIHIDSPMAVKATRIYSRHLDIENLDADLLEEGRSERLFPKGVFLHTSVQDSKELNTLDGPRIIIAGSGMLTGGRVVHHLKRVLPDPNSLVMLAGYQAEGTRGRRLLEGAKTLRIHRTEYPVRCQTLTLKGLSGHADANELIQWFQSGPGDPSAIFITHGELESAKALEGRLQKESRAWIHVPDMNERFDLESLIPSRSRRK